MEGDFVYDLKDQFQSISIHTLRMEGDALASFPTLIIEQISIHTLRMEGDSASAVMVIPFLNFNPHPPHGG